MARSTLALAVCGLLVGCGGPPEDAEAEAALSADVTASANKVVYGPDSAAMTVFTDSDDLYAYDLSADPYTAVAQLHVNGNRYTVYAGGAGNRSTPFHLALPAGTPLLIRSCLGMGAFIYSCNGWVSFTAH